MGVWFDLWFGSDGYDQVMGAIEALNDTLGEESDHVAPVRCTIDVEDDIFTVRIHCQRCGQLWNHAYLMPAMMGKKIPGSKLLVLGGSWADRWIREELVPIGVKVMNTDCDSMIGRQQVQELVVDWLTAAGAAGLPYSRVLGRLILLELGELDEKVGIAGAIKALELEHRPVDGTAYLFLPAGHPNRGW